MQQEMDTQMPNKQDVKCDCGGVRGVNVAECD